MSIDAKDPDDNAEYGIDFRDQFVLEARPQTEYDAADILFFAQDTGFYYEVTTAGRTGLSYPRNLPRVSGQTMNYGSCVLTCRHPSAVSLPSISAAWAIDPSGELAVLSQRIDGFVAYVTLEDGADGVDYEVTCRVTPSVGNPIDKTITVQVRSQ